MESHEIWNQIIERKRTFGTAALKPVERVNKAAYDLELGGLSGFLYNVSPTGDSNPWTELRAMADAIETVGVGECANALRSAADLLETKANRAAATWKEVLAPVGHQLEAEIAPVVDDAVESLWDRLDMFTQEQIALGTVGKQDTTR